MSGRPASKVKLCPAHEESRITESKEKTMFMTLVGSLQGELLHTGLLCAAGDSSTVGYFVLSETQFALPQIGFSCTQSPLEVRNRSKIRNAGWFCFFESLIVMT